MTIVVGTKKKFSPYLIAKTIRYIITKRVAECILSNWEGMQNVDWIKQIPTLIKPDELIHPIDPNDLSLRQMKELGFTIIGKHTSNPKGNEKVMVIPIWLFPFFKDKFTCCSVDDCIEKLYKKSEMSISNFGGWMNYGVIPKK